MINYKSIYNDFEKYREKKISLPLIKHSHVKNIIEEHKRKNLFDIELIGHSIEGKEIYSLSLGRGNIKILVWSQMHGDEPTATASIFDLINFFSDNDIYNDFKKNILEKLKIYFVPMLNPDGAELFKRENSLNIDLNRDALRIEAHESKILWNLAKRIKPQFALNLHDQNSYYTAGRSSNTAAISLLAPPTDFEKSITETRKKSMQVILRINEVLSNFIPLNIARYNDDFEPRAFGDNFTKANISSILIESGFLIGDTEKSEIRKLNFISLLSAFDSIANEDYKEKNIEEYFSIPENNSLLFDLLLRNLSITKNNKSFKIDVGIIRERKYDSEANQFYYVGKIKEIGDLSIYYGIEEYNLNGYDVDIPKIFLSNNRTKLNIEQFNLLHNEGYGFVFQTEHNYEKDYTSMPINILCYKNYKPQLAVDEYANLLITKENNKIYIIINGFFQVLNDSKNRILNSLVIH